MEDQTKKKKKEGESCKGKNSFLFSRGIKIKAAFFKFWCLWGHTLLHFESICQGQAQGKSMFSSTSGDIL